MRRGVDGDGFPGGEIVGVYAENLLRFQAFADLEARLAIVILGQHEKHAAIDRGGAQRSGKRNLEAQWRWGTLLSRSRTSRRGHQNQDPKKRFARHGESLHNNRA